MQVPWLAPVLPLFPSSFFPRAPAGPSTPPATADGAKSSHALGNALDDLVTFPSGIRAGLNHAIGPDKQIGVGIEGEPIKQRLQLWPKTVAAKSCDRMKFVHVSLPRVWNTIGVTRRQATRLPRAYGQRQASDDSAQKGTRGIPVVKRKGG